MTNTSNLDLIGKQFISQRHAYPVVWTVLRYHRCDGWVCEESEHKTTCEFTAQEILDWQVKPTKKSRKANK